MNAMVEDRRAAWVALGGLVEPGNRELGMLIRAVGPCRALEMVCSASVSESLGGTVAARLDDNASVPAALALAAEAFADADRLGVRIVTPDDEEWPPQFGDLARISRGYTGAPVDRDTDPPIVLWVRGAPPLAETLARSVSIVGARAATGYGQYVATDLASGLAERGWTVVSGGALGIDAAAHRAALAVGGHTMAVLACGIDRPYPVSHTALFEQIGEDGLLVTEWAPQMPPFRLRFLVRNRVIAAATAGTIMVEAARRSGARQTLRRARDLGRSVLVVPGPVTSAMSVGCHEELRLEGTRLVSSVSDVLEEVGRIGVDLAPPRPAEERPHDRLDPLAAKVLDAVPPRRPRTAEEVAAAAGVSGREARRTLPLLVETGLVVALPGGYRLAPPARRPVAGA
jgi:DNA processing protein